MMVDIEVGIVRHSEDNLHFEEEMDRINFLIGMNCISMQKTVAHAFYKGGELQFEEKIIAHELHKG